MSRYLMCLLVFAAPVLVAQAPGAAPRRQALEAQVVQRFMENYRRQAGLTPEQFARFRAVTQRSFTERRERQRREGELWSALETQMRPGVAANPDSVTRLLDGLTALRQAEAEQVRNDDREFATFLTPVQRAQLFLAFERLRRNIDELVRQRLRPAGAGGGGAGGDGGGAMDPPVRRPGGPA